MLTVFVEETVHILIQLACCQN